jgi:HAD superfamily hydrolase (TIGR01549 family)
MTTLPPPAMIFFDIGNVLVSDDPSGLFIYRGLYERLGGAARLTPEEFFDGRTRHVAAGGQLWSYARECLSDGDFEEFQTEIRRGLYSQWERTSPELPGMADAIRRLAGEFRIGIIANQPPEIEGVLRKRGLWDLFEVHGVSGSIGMEKPDRGIFDWALERARVRPDEALMVGDRADNDVAPAKALGMRTLLLRLGFEQRGWRPDEPFGELYVRSLQAASISGLAPRTDAEKPDFTAESPEELVAVLTGLKTGAVA